MFLILSALLDVHKVCKKGWILFKGSDTYSCYTYFRYAQLWDISQSKCEEFHSEFIKFQNYEKYMQITNTDGSYWVNISISKWTETISLRFHLSILWLVISDETILEFLNIGYINIVGSRFYQHAVISTFRYINKFLCNRLSLSFNEMTQLYQDSFISTFRVETDGLI